jgi:hypothetical protein
MELLKMFNSNVDLGYDGSTGKYMFVVKSNDGKSWMSYDVTDLIAQVLKYEDERKLKIGYQSGDKDSNSKVKAIGFLG